MLYGREDVSGHGFIRAAKPLKMNNSAPAESQRAAKRSAQNERFSAASSVVLSLRVARLPDERFTPAVSRSEWLGFNPCNAIGLKKDFSRSTAECCLFG